MHAILKKKKNAFIYIIFNYEIYCNIGYILYMPVALHPVQPWQFGFYAEYKIF